MSGGREGGGLVESRIDRNGWEGTATNERKDKGGEKGRSDRKWGLMFIVKWDHKWRKGTIGGKSDKNTLFVPPCYY